MVSVWKILGKKQVYLFRVRLISGTAYRGTAEPAEPKEMTVLLQLPLVKVMK